MLKYLKSVFILMNYVDHCSGFSNCYINKICAAGWSGKPEKGTKGYLTHNIQRSKYPYKERSVILADCYKNRTKTIKRSKTLNC